MLAELIAFIVYALLLSGLILHNGFFGLFDDPTISRKKFALLLLGKLTAVPLFILVYTKMYGGIENFDTGKFYHDVKVIFDYGKKEPGFLFQLILGLQDDSPGSSDYENALKYTLNWDNGTVKDYMYNDNRILIRSHVVLNFLAFNFYGIHALLSCFLSFIGIVLLYKTFKEWFKGKEIPMLLVFCFFPALWFYTGAMLKEGLTFFVLGCTLYLLKRVINREYSLVIFAGLCFLLFLSLLLKPYLLVFSAFCFALFFKIHYTTFIKRKALVFFGCLLAATLGVNGLSVVIKHRSLLEAAIKHQHRFIGVSRGGIFLADSVNFIRLSNDTSQLEKVSDKKDVYAIKQGTSYMYWKTVDQKDTLYCLENNDTTTRYNLVYIITPGKSNVELPQSGTFAILGACLYYTLFHPAFFNARNALQVLASCENLAVFAALSIIFLGLIKRKKEKFIVLVFLTFALCLCILIGLTAPNSGAIFRYRSPAMVFLLLGALYFIKDVRRIDSRSEN